MNKRIVFFGLVGVAILTLTGFARPTQAAEGQMDVPSYALGITEETFAALSAINGKSCDPQTTGQSDSCPQLALDLNGRIVCRVEHFGELYRFQFVGDIGAWDGLLERYLPDNFYASGGKYYWVANGYKMQLTKGKAWKQFLRRVRHDFPARTAISEKDYLALNNGGAHDTALTQRLAGHVIMRVESHGELEYVRAGVDEPTLPLLKRAKGHSFFEQVQNLAAGVSIGTMNEMVEAAF